MKRGAISSECGFVILASLCTLGAASTVVQAQSLFKLHVGDNASSISLPSGPLEENHPYKEYTYRSWWPVGDGEILTVIASKSGKIDYVELGWITINKIRKTDCDLPWIKFGETTRSDIRRQLGSYGFQFEGRRDVLDAPGGPLMVNSYKFGSNVVTFYTRIPTPDDSKPESSSENWTDPDHARLEMISIASLEYAESEWGKRIYDPAYKPVVWK